MSSIIEQREAAAAGRRAVVHAYWRQGDTPTILAKRLATSAAAPLLAGAPVPSAEQVRHDMITLGLWTVRSRSAGRRERHAYHQRKTVHRNVAAELALAVLQFEELLDTLAVTPGVAVASEVGIRMTAARAQIHHAKQIARQAGVWNPQAGARS